MGPLFDDDGPSVAPGNVRQQLTMIQNGTASMSRGVSSDKRSAVKAVVKLLVVVVAVSTMVAGPALAQPGAGTPTDGGGDGPGDSGGGDGDVSGNGEINICDDSGYLPELVNAVVQLAIYGGIIAMVVSYMLSNFMKAIPIDTDKFNEIRRQAIHGGIKMLIAGPLALIVFEAAGLEYASECIELVPI